MNRRLRIVEIIAVLAVAIFLGYQFFASYYSAITTESAYYFEYSEGVDIFGTIIRNEYIVDMSNEGTLHFIVSDGERIAKGGTIAEVYSDDRASSAASRITEIDRQLETINEIEGYNNVSAVDMNTVNAKLQKNLENFLFITSSRHYTGSSEAKSELINSLIKKQVAKGENANFATLKESLNAERIRLSSEVGAPRSRMTSNYSGYFVSSVDGLEQKLKPDDLSIFTPEYLESVAKEMHHDEGRSGKVVGDYRWYIAAIIPLDSSMSYKSGETVKLKIHSANQTVNATVERVNYSKDTDTATVVFSCNEMSSELAVIRSGSMTVVKNEYKGLRIPQKSVRIVDGVTGTYVVSGLEAKFVKTEVVYSNDEYIICKLNTTDESLLRLYDKVVVRGKGLYDGKIIY